MARPTSDLLKSSGTAFEVLKALINGVLDRGGNDEDVRRILKDKKLVADIAKLILTGKVTVEEEAEFLRVNYDLTLEQAIAEGAFDSKDSDITSSNFPNADKENGEETRKTKLYHFGCDMSSESVVATMDKEGFRPATLRELLAFGAKYPDEQRKYPIVGLGSVAKVRDDRLVPCLRLSGDERSLSLRWWGSYWFGRYRFLAVSKS